MFMRRKNYLRHFNSCVCICIALYCSVLCQLNTMQMSNKTAPELNQMKFTFGNRAMSHSLSLGAGCLWANGSIIVGGL